MAGNGTSSEDEDDEEEDDEDDDRGGPRRMDQVIPTLQVIGAILLILSIPICWLWCIFTRCLKRRPKEDGTGERWVCRKANRSCKCWLSGPRSMKEYLQVKGIANIDLGGQNSP